MKKTSYLLLSLVLVLTLFPTTIFAYNDKVEDLSEDGLNTYLINAGYPQDVIDILEFEQKISFYTQQAVYTSHKTTEGHLSEKSESITNLDVSARAINNFTQTLVMSQVRTNTSGLAQALVTYNWEWDYIPLFTMTDKWGIAWTDDWDPLPTTARYSYRAIAESSPGVVSASSSTGNISGYDAFLPGSGIGFAVNLIAGFTQNGIFYSTTKHKGWSEIRIQKAHNGSGTLDSSSGVANYFHKQG
ncbi:hypothetical protein ACFOQM_04960 [Paenibacillus sp. GCM10012307]|uniref:Uncharacterized protein n=1 Tax=Paenibacillus roseus TaxID=2798579 RepID=A0A934IZQ4_9BACL|nr:hypothetical protein [Paenibacillus roseus]MBJ6360659.1 hypothetical protein [Paenibacillus roseus]